MKVAVEIKVIIGDGNVGFTREKINGKWQYSPVLDGDVIFKKAVNGGEPEKAIAFAQECVRLLSDKVL